MLPPKYLSGQYKYLTGKFSILYSNNRTLIIGLISDTHIAFPNEKLPTQVVDAFRGVDLILHAGDIWIPSVLDELESAAPIKAAWGDDDLKVDLGHDGRMMKERSIRLDGVNIWVTHEKPRYALLNPEGEQQVHPREDRPDVVVFGHTHYAAIETYKDVLLVNPGSATVPNYVPKLGTIGMMTISDGKAEARIVRLG